MPDREKVINDLQDAVNDDWMWQHADYYAKAMENALALLKEQGAVEPYIAGSGESFETAETWWYECGNCNKPIDPNDKFCRHCGRQVKWE